LRLNVEGLSVKMYAWGMSWASNQERVTTLLFVIPITEGTLKPEKKNDQHNYNLYIPTVSIQWITKILV